MKLYHYTSVQNRGSIQKNGLIPKSKRGKYIQYPPRICLTIYPNDDYAFDYVGREGIDIWEVEVDKNKLKVDRNSDVGYHFYVEEPLKTPLLINTVI